MINANLFIGYAMKILLFSIFTININKKFENIDKRFDSMDKRFDSMDKRFDSMDKRFDSMDKKLDYLTGKKPKDISTISSCFLIAKDKNGKKYYGSGNLVNIDNSVLVATCLHNFYDYTTGMIYIPEKIINKGKRLQFDKEKIIFNITSIYDLALIPIKEEDNIKDNAAFIYNSTSEGGEKLYGTNYYFEEYSFDECYVVSTKLGPSLLVTNCTGKSHYSGTGYFNTDGFLTAIHKSELKYANELSEKDQPEEYTNELKHEDEISEENVNEFKRKIEFYDEGHRNEIKFYDVSTRTVKDSGDVKSYLERTFNKHRMSFLEDIFEDSRSILVDAKYLINLYRRREILIKK